VKHADEFSVTPKCIDIVNDELDNELFLAAVAAGTAFKKYKDKRQVSTVLFEMVLDEKEEAYGIPTLHDTEEYKKQEAAKEKEKRKKERLQRKKQDEAVETNEDGGKNQNWAQEDKEGNHSFCITFSLANVRSLFHLT
jgi:hypothetical protein